MESRCLSRAGPGERALESRAFQAGRQLPRPWAGSAGQTLHQHKESSVVQGPEPGGEGCDLEAREWRMFGAIVKSLDSIASREARGGLKAGNPRAASGV